CFYKSESKNDKTAVVISKKNFPEATLSKIDPELAAKYKEEKEKRGANADADKVVDPTQTGVVGHLDLNKESSQGTTQYVRGEQSQFDRESNPKERSSATSILGVTAEKQNPWLTNIALARKIRADGTVSLVQYLGNDAADASKIDDPKSLQAQNDHNVVNFSELELSKEIAATDLKTQKDQADFAIKVYKKIGEDKLSTEQKENLAKFVALKAELEAIDLKSPEGYLGLNPTGNTFIRADGSTGAVFSFGDDAKTSDDVLGTETEGSKKALADAEAATYTDGKITTAGTGAGALGLIGVNFKNGGTEQAIQGTEEKSQSSTRVFGRQYNTQDRADAKFNSYYDANVLALSKADLAAEVKNLSDTSDETAVKNLIDKTKIDYHLAVKPQKLDYVQYGRVTGNLDPIKTSDLSDDERAKIENKELVMKRAAFKNKINEGENNVDNFYFYRGIGATTLKQMESLKQEKPLVYQGHALMYGIDNNFHGADTSQIPSAFGAAGSHAIGNFVTANVDLANNKVDGRVYNVWTDGSKEKIVDNLVKFKGQVFGNTVLGKAERTYKAGDADFRASFFGEQADEMGGSFNSITTAEKYSSDDVWGGSFGAKRTVETQKVDDHNGYIGDLPDANKPVVTPKP
ncbi:hypothetical protein AKG33_06480, partial [Dichelobacter nodosus]